MKPKLNKDQAQKLGLSILGFVVLVYVYFTLFLGPLNNSRAKMLSEIDSLQLKVGASKNDVAKASNLERQASAATGRFAAMKALSPEGAPIAWFPPRMKAFFASQGVDKATARLENSVAFKDPELTEWTRFNWTIDVPQTDFAALGQAISALENAEPLLTIVKLSVKAMPEPAELQQVTMSVSTALAKR